AGDYTVRFTVTDSDGDSSVVEKHVTIGQVQSQPDPADPSKTNLVVGGDNGDNVIQFKHTSKPQVVKVVVDGVSLGKFSPTGRLGAYGGGGNDRITVDPLLKFSAYIDAGYGDDVVKGGSRCDVLIGGLDTDQLFGGGSRDVL